MSGVGCQVPGLRLLTHRKKAALGLPSEAFVQAGPRAKGFPCLNQAILQFHNSDSGAQARP